MEHMDFVETEKRKLVTIEDVVTALAGQCDGARKRDGRGFNRADAQEGGRLAALLSSGVSWSYDDAKRALELTGRYSKQAGFILGDGRESKSSGIETALRNGKVKLENEPVAEQKPYNYACFSPGGKRVHLWRLAWVEDFSGLLSDLRAICSIRHGHRKVYMDPKESAELTINGKKRKATRSEVDFNGSTREAIVALCEKYGFVLEPAIAAPMDDEIDNLRRHERAAWVHRGTRDGRKGVWAVFDLAAKNPGFSEAVKTRMKGRFVCDPSDDWNWFLEWDEQTMDTVRRIAIEFRFAVSDDIRYGRA